MSFIVKGIDLPEKNKGLYFHIFNGKVEIIHPLDACEVEHTDAQAIQIPKGHGDIKDIDQITKLLPKMYLGGISHMVINDAPTILEEEEE